MFRELRVSNSLLPGGDILIEEEVWALLSPFRQILPSAPETGGILLGFRRGPHLHVTYATSPQPEDRQSRFSFFRAERHHQRLATGYWANTQQTGDYLGEWHTHPEPHPSPSGIDVTAWKKASNRRKDALLFIILGTETAAYVAVGLYGAISGHPIALPSRA
ncbi:hypothetical protein BTHE68_40120 [Burkholderia sp. THE68]|uniref:Mov34/MPN/PAD-1 family protein n=1 Tax=Burkholderia sp. THE68 TaxID=758782 RepID=UPI0013190D5B|nr:Mov34/MPN/PAD-1 family protein [Burkholderia sp. THE68]BBU30278.1 hypothetical protein BTHE68_40120 [Burkholderia sp. THE68]